MWFDIDTDIGCDGTRHAKRKFRAVIERGSTYEKAAEQLAPYVQELSYGARALPFQVKDETGRTLSLMDDHLAGQSLVLLFLNKTEAERSRDLLTCFGKNHSRLQSAGITVVAFSADSSAERNRQLQRDTNFSWSIPGDSTGAIFASYGIHKGSGPDIRVVVLTRNRLVRAWFDDVSDGDDLIEQLLTHMNRGNRAMNESWSTPHAPVLMVPSVFSKEECGALIDSFVRQGPLTVRKPRPGEFDGDYKIPVYEHNRQDRIDHIIKDKQTLEFLDSRIFSRITPEIQRAFAFNVTRREDLHIAHYHGERSGNEMGHRDNVSAETAYRRFALSLNLNDDYEGGEVVFNEYDNASYKGTAGSALVFSSSLLHEVKETTQGHRYTLISHLFNEESLPRG